MPEGTQGCRLELATWCRMVEIGGPQSRAADWYRSAACQEPAGGEWPQRAKRHLHLRPKHRLLSSAQIPRQKILLGPPVPSANKVGDRGSRRRAQFKAPAQTCRCRGRARRPTRPAGPGASLALASSLRTAAGPAGPGPPPSSVPTPHGRAGSCEQTDV